MVILSVGSFVFTFLTGHGNIIVGFYGLRIYLLHFPVIYIIAQVFQKQDVLQMGKVLLWLSIPMILLVTWQFFSPQSAWPNRGVGGDVEGSGFAGAMGYFRSSGTFSFTNGLSSFFGMVACFIFYFWLNPKRINYILLILATFSLFVAIPLSISRTLFFQTFIILLFALFGALNQSKNIGKVIGLTFIFLILLVLISQTQLFQLAIEVFSTRFESASGVEGGLKGTLIDRYFGTIITHVKESFSNPVFGKGMGLGTNAASQLLTGSRDFLIAEDEWGRILGESGIIFGLGIIAIRVLITLKITIKAFFGLAFNDNLPWILTGFVILNVPQGQWAQPTALGFGILGAGLALALFEKSETTH